MAPLPDGAYIWWHYNMSAYTWWHYHLAFMAVFQFWYSNTGEAWIPLPNYFRKYLNGSCGKFLLLESKVLCLLWWWVSPLRFGEMLVQLCRGEVALFYGGWTWTKWTGKFSSSYYFLTLQFSIIFCYVSQFSFDKLNFLISFWLLLSS